MIQRTEQEIMQNWEGDVDKPLVSICCITYNHEHYINEAIESFLMQETDFPFEIIIRDDCSIDNTAEIIRNYAQQYPRLIKPIYEKENQYSRGVRATPAVIKKSTGKYIAFCEGDDYWTDTLKLQKQVDFLETNMEYTGSGHQAKIIGDSIETKNRFYGINIPNNLERNDFLRGCPFQLSTFVFRSKIVKKYPPDINVLSGDKLLYLLVSTFGSIRYFDQPMSIYRQHKGGISHNVTMELRKKDFNIVPWITSIDSGFPKYQYHSYLNESMLFVPDGSNVFNISKHSFLYFVYSFSFFPKNIFFTGVVFVRYLRSRLKLRTRLYQVKDKLK